MIVMHVGGPAEWQARCPKCEWLSAVGPEEATDAAAAAHVCGAVKPVALTDAEWARVVELEAKQREVGHGAGPSDEEEAELEQLRAKAKSIAAEPELPDDPKTRFTDEARRPLLAGGDYLEREKQRECREWVERIEAEAVKLGEVAIRAAIAVLSARLAR